MQHPSADANPPLGKAMVLDDDPDVRASLRDALDDEGFDTVAFGAGQEALAWLDGHAAETRVMVLDLMMPAMSGDQFLMAKEKHPTAAGVPVILMTASGREAYEPVLSRHSIFRCLSKPLMLDALLNAIRACVDRRAAQPGRPGPRAD